MTREQVGPEIGRSTSWISRVETGRLALRPRDLRDLLDIYRVHDSAIRRQLEQLTGTTRERGWWSRYANAIPEAFSIYLGLEHEATTIHTYESDLVPGLLQNRDYAEAIFRASARNLDERAVSDRLAVRMRRQEILHRPHPPKLSVVLDEAVLHRNIGGREVMERQLDKLITDSGTVDLRILPHHKPRALLAVQNFVVLGFSQPGLVTAHIETPGGGVFEEGDNVTIYARLFESLQEAAEDRDRSREMMTQARNRMKFDK